jgi:hypothetical protein
VNTAQADLGELMRSSADAGDGSVFAGRRVTGGADRRVMAHFLATGIQHGLEGDAPAPMRCWSVGG